MKQEAELLLASWNAIQEQTLSTRTTASFPFATLAALPDKLADGTPDRTRFKTLRGTSPEERPISHIRQPKLKGIFIASSVRILATRDTRSLLSGVIYSGSKIESRTGLLSENSTSPIHAIAIDPRDHSAQWPIDGSV